MLIQMNTYDLVVENDSFVSLDAHIKSVYDLKKIFVVTDENVNVLYGGQLKTILSDYQVEIIAIPPFETSKSYAMYEKVVSALIHKGMKKNHLLIAFGGGVVGDLTGFVAGTLYRGVSFIQIPTTLLAMVDSSIGGKTGIDTNEGKNMVGVFKNPLKVIIDPKFLDTLPKIEYKNGLAEVLKAGIIGDKSLYEYLKTHDQLTLDEIVKAINVKKKIVLEDPFEQNKRMFLNFGHTFGHAIERHYDYAIKHGVAISYGMLLSLAEGITLGITPKYLYDEVKTILLRLELVKEPLLKKDMFISYISNDKKQSDNGLSFIFIKGLEEPEIVKGVKFK